MLPMIPFLIPSACFVFAIISFVILKYSERRKNDRPEIRKWSQLSRDERRHIEQRDRGCLGCGSYTQLCANPSFNDNYCKSCWELA